VHPSAPSSPAERPRTTDTNNSIAGPMRSSSGDFDDLTRPLPDGSPPMPHEPASHDHQNDHLVHTNAVYDSSSGSDGALSHLSASAALLAVCARPNLICWGEGFQSWPSYAFLELRTTGSLPRCIYRSQMLLAPISQYGSASVVSPKAADSTAALTLPRSARPQMTQQPGGAMLDKHNRDWCPKS
jgi:hypothetical protein